MVNESKCFYAVDEGWRRRADETLRKERMATLGLAQGVACDSKDRVYILSRYVYSSFRGVSPAVLVFGSEGNFLTSWGEDIFSEPHGIWISHDDLVYCTDIKDHIVVKTTLDGEVLLTLGTKGESGRPGHPFNSPTKAVATRSDEIYVADGYFNQRVHKFDSKGNLLLSWGSKGNGPAQFDLPHGIWADEERVLVIDRPNNRIEHFTANGEYTGEWNGLLGPQDIFIHESIVYVAEGGRRKICMLNPDGEVLTRWGEKGDRPGQFAASPHGLCVDREGSVYVGEVTAPNLFQKFIPRRSM